MKYSQLFSKIALIFAFFSVGFFSFVKGQVVTPTPALPLPDDTVTIVFDATQGDGGLAGFTGDVYAHTGVITDKSTSATDWKDVAAPWGTTDPKVRMTRIAADRYQMKYHIRNFYGTNPADTIKRLAFVFRSGDGNVTGRDVGGTDIFVDVALPGWSVDFLNPPNGQTILTPGMSYNIIAGASRADTMRLFVGGTEVAKQEGTSISYNFTASATGTIELTARAEAGGQSREQSTSIFVRPMSPNVAALPAGVRNGINYIDDTTVTLVLYAPQKDHVFVIGEFNDWSVTDLNFMNKTPDGNRYWKTITGLMPGKEYAYQYLIDSELKVADYLAEKILDPWADPQIPEANYPNLKPYPSQITTGIASVFQTAKPQYQWQSSNFTPPKVTDLVIYELHVRDFSDDDSYQAVIDRLDYIENLGINALQLMPVMEFENNDSWGYNPSFMLAADKYYGTEEKLKELIDKCHQRGIAVILDIVLNHQFGQSPMVRMYWDDVNDQPAANSPWFNQVPTHDFNVGYDMNHESQATIDFTNRVVRHWIEEYRIDGYRFDLSKGFTQNNTLGDVGAWGRRDLNRIALWKNIADTIWSVDPDNYVILEHFADNDEERELANYGMMFWGNLNHNYNEATMGYHDNGKSNFSWISYRNRGWAVPTLVGYMESHDEERLMYKNLQFGARNTAIGYDIRTLETALARLELAGAFFYTIPGPKMIWQFGELGYEVEIDFNGRTGRKPVRWEYFENPNRQKLYKVWAALAKLRIEEPAFETQNFCLNVGGNMKTIHLDHSDMNVVVLGNFDTRALDIIPNFQQVGTWYEFFTGDSITIANTSDAINLQAGEYRLYTTKRLAQPDLTTGREELGGLPGFTAYPNPAQSSINIDLLIPEAGQLDVALYDFSGKKVAQIVKEQATQGYRQLEWQRPAHLAAGMYLLKVQAGERSDMRKLMVN
jgi:1,4-alpha-glucan branching enzyme